MYVLRAASVLVCVSLIPPAVAGESGVRAIDCEPFQRLDADRPVAEPWRRPEAEAGLRLVMPAPFTFELSIQSVRGREFRANVPLGSLSVDPSTGDVAYADPGVAQSTGCTREMR